MTLVFKASLHYQGKNSRKFTVENLLYISKNVWFLPEFHKESQICWLACVLSIIQLKFVTLVFAGRTCIINAIWIRCGACIKYIFYKSTQSKHVLYFVPNSYQSMCKPQYSAIPQKSIFFNFFIAEIA